MVLPFLQPATNSAFLAGHPAMGGQVTSGSKGLYELREPISLLAACLIVVGFGFAMHGIPMQRTEHLATPVTVRLVEIPEVPPPAPMPEPTHPPQAKPLPPTPQPTPKIETAPPLPTPAPAPVVEIPPPAPKLATQPPPQPVASAPAPRSNPAAEGAYQAKARAYIEKNKQYPEEALQMNMSGSVVVLYVIGRDGKLIRAEVERSSGHSLLDQAALRAVRKARFDPMPDDAWVTQKEQAFRTRIDFTVD